MESVQRIEAATPSGERGARLRVLRRFPFTLGMIFAILVTSAITNTLGRPITPDDLARWGVGLPDLRAFAFHRLLTATFHVLRPYMAVTITITLLLFVGACEYRLRSWRTAIVFWATHVSGYIGAFSLVALAQHFGAEWPQRFASVRDVGASNGVLGTAGAAVTLLPGRARRIAWALFLAYLVTALVVSFNIWDIEHLVAFFVGTALGGWFHVTAGRRWPGVLPELRIEHRQRPETLSWAVAVLGITDLLSAFLLPHHEGWERLDSWLPMVGVHWPRSLMFVVGLGLLVVARGVRRAQRGAWWITTVFLALSVVMHSQVSISHVEVTVASVLLVFFVMWRGSFAAPSRPETARVGWTILASMLVLVPLYGLAGLFVLRSQFTPAFAPLDGLEEVVSRLFFLSADNYTGHTKPAMWFLTSIPLFGWLGVLYGVFEVMRTQVAPARTPTDEEVARGILARNGASSTSYMTLWPGNSLFFSSAHDGYVAYRVGAATAVVLGDPVCSRHRAADIVREFAAFADANGWDHVFYAATEPLLSSYVRLGYQPIKVGEEAVIPLPALEFRGKEWQSMRTAINKAQRDGVRFEMYEGGSVPDEYVAQFEEISREWSGSHNLPEMEFTLGSVRDVFDPEVNVAVAIDGDGRVHAFADWLPIYARAGWVIDLMRRRSDCMSGAMDFVIGRSLMYFKDRGYSVASLAAAPLADIGRDDDASLVQRFLGEIYERFDTYYNFKSLFEYKEKFQPAWESVYLMHRGIPNVLRVAQALVHAHLPGLGVADVATILRSQLARRLSAAPRDRGAP